MKNNNWHLGLLLGALGVFALHTSAAQAGGFQVRLHSAALTGLAYAGNAAIGDEISAMVDNPANLAYLAASQVSLNLTPIWPTIKFRSNAGVPTGDAGVSAVVPAGYAAWKLNHRWTFGLALQTPFGLKTDYSVTSGVQSLNMLSDLQTNRLTPTVGMKINDFISIGLGFQLMYSNAELTRQVPIGGGATAISRVKGHGYGMSGVGGIIIQPWKSTRFGLAYNSANSATVRGNQSLNPLVRPRLPSRADVKYPDFGTFSIHHELNDQWAVMGSIVYTRWSRFKELRVKMDGQPDDVIIFNWRNTIFWSLGTTYKPTDKWILRAGIGLDETPVSLDTLRTPGIPDSRRKWVSFGAGYNMGSFDLNVGYTHEFVNRARIDRGAVAGDVNQHVDFISLELKYKF